jgi:hypothetical protein
VSDKIFADREAVITINNLRNSDVPSDFDQESASILLLSDSDQILCSEQVEITTMLELAVILEP